MMTWFWGGYNDEDPQTGEDPPEGENVEGLTTRRFYLNLLVLNKEDVVRNVAEKKVAARFPRLKGLQKVAGKLANRKLSEEDFLLKIGQKLASAMPVRMAERGIIVACAPRFIQKNLIVVELRVLDVDQEELFKAQEKEQQLENINSMISGIAYVSTSLSNFVASRLDENMLAKIDAKLFETVPIVLAEKMEEKAGLKVEACTKRDVDQAAWFFDCLKQIGAPSSPDILQEEAGEAQQSEEGSAAPKTES